MGEEEDKDCYRVFHKLLDCIRVESKGFDIRSSCEYFRNQNQYATRISDGIRHFVLVVLTLKALVHSKLLTSISPIYVRSLISYIETTQIEKNWCLVKESPFYLPVSRYYMETIKYELVQYNTHDCMYVLILRCMTFHETEVTKALSIIRHFMAGCTDPTVSVVPQVKWKFFGNPYMSIVWIVGIPKYAMDTFSGYRRKLVNEFWNDVYGGPDWRLSQSKKKSLMDYMKTLSNYKGGNPFKRLVSKKGSPFEPDDVVFAKFSEDKDVYIRRGLFSFSALLLVALIVFGIWFFYRRLFSS